MRKIVTEREICWKKKNNYVGFGEKGYPMKETPKQKAKIKKVMKEGKEGKLHSGSKTGPLVTNPKQKIAIALSEAGLSRKKK